MRAVTVSEPGKIPDCYVQTFGGFDVTCLNEDMHNRTCGYWYTVKSFCSPHTAFATKEGLLRWLDERGLKLTGNLPEHRGDAAFIHVTGQYRRAMHRNRQIFDSVAPLLETVELDNAQYTKAKITQDVDQSRTVHFMNCNYEREIFDYAETRAKCGK